MLPSFLYKFSIIKSNGAMIFSKPYVSHLPPCTTLRAAPTEQKRSVLF